MLCFLLLHVVHMVTRKYTDCDYNQVSFARYVQVTIRKAKQDVSQYFHYTTHFQGASSFYHPTGY